MRLFGGEDDQYDRARVLRDLESVPTKVLVKKRSRILRFAKVWSKITPGRSEGTTPSGEAWLTSAINAIIEKRQNGG